jgi:hypothetical protein
MNRPDAAIPKKQVFDAERLLRPGVSVFCMGRLAEKTIPIQARKPRLGIIPLVDLCQQEPVCCQKMGVQQDRGTRMVCRS